jgi:hypothetical protein
MLLDGNVVPQEGLEPPTPSLRTMASRFSLHFICLQVVA